MAEKVSRSADATTDHDQIRKWVEDRGGHPACVKGTGHGQGDVGMIRIDFPGFSGENKLEPISWEEWFKAFDENRLALLISPEHDNRFNKLVSRENVHSEGGEQSHTSSGHQRGQHSHENKSAGQTSHEKHVQAGRKGGEHSH